MLNARDLLGRLMQAGMTNSSSNRINHALGSGGLGQPGNPIGDLLRNLQGGGQTHGFGGLAEAAQSMFGDAKQSVQSGNPLAIGGGAPTAGQWLVSYLRDHGESLCANKILDAKRAGFKEKAIQKS